MARDLVGDDEIHEAIVWHYSSLPADPLESLTEDVLASQAALLGQGEGVGCLRCITRPWGRTL